VRDVLNRLCDRRRASAGRKTFSVVRSSRDGEGSADVRITRRSINALGLLLALIAFAGAVRSHAQSSSSSPAEPALTVTGTVDKPLSLSLRDLQNLPRKTVKVLNSHDGKEETYEGVLLADLLAQAGVPSGEKIRGAAMATYVEADAADGYRAILSLAETDSSFQDSEIIVADKMNGQPIGTNAGPLRLVVPHDKRPGRWVRMLQSIKVVTIPK
jgi:DMSO/TMAO reductase YedYZ molybdopterin-dependent catalytic subunit